MNVIQSEIERACIHVTQLISPATAKYSDHQRKNTCSRLVSLNMQATTGDIHQIACAEEYNPSISL